MHLTLFSLAPFLLALFPLPTLSFPSSSSLSNLPPCNEIYRPCKCPTGTTFKNLTSWGIIGAPAVDVRGIMDSFFDQEWLGGINPYRTTGREGVVGATRAFNFTGLNNATNEYYQIAEVLTRQEKSPDGSFVQGFAQVADPPVVKVPGGGEYHGEWALLYAQQTLIPNETAVAWQNWRCEIGLTFDAAPAHEGGIANTSAILQKAGKHTGVDVAPFTKFFEVRQD